MNKYSIKYQFAPGQIVKLGHRSVNKLTDAYLKIKFEGIKKKFKEDNPQYFTEEYQARCERFFKAKEEANELKMCNYVDAMLEGKKKSPASIQEGMDLLNSSFQFKV